MHDNLAWLGTRRSHLLSPFRSSDQRAVNLALEPTPPVTVANGCYTNPREQEGY